VTSFGHSLLVLSERFIREFEDGRWDNSVGVVYFLAEDFGVVLLVGTVGVGEEGLADEAILVGLDLGHQIYYTVPLPLPIIGSHVGNASTRNTLPLPSAL
jgi:hypothetical protein